jgi:hypothetical protein
VHRQALNHPQQGQHLGQRRPGIRQVQPPAAGLQGAGGSHQRADGGGIREPQAGQVHRQDPDSSGYLRFQRVFQLLDGGYVRLSGQHHHRPGVAGGHTDFKQVHDAVPGAVMHSDFSSSISRMSFNATTGRVTTFRSGEMIQTAAVTEL